MWSLSTQAKASVRTTLAITDTVQESSVSATAITIGTRSNYGYTTVRTAQVNNRIVRNEQSISNPVISQPIFTADATTDRYSTPVVVTFRPRSAFNMSQLTIPATQAGSLYVLTPPGLINYNADKTTNYNNTFRVVLVGATGSAPSNLPIFNIRSSIDVPVITNNTVSTAAYSFVPRYTTSTTVNVAPSSYATLSSTNQRSISAVALNSMYMTSATQIGPYPTGSGLTFQSATSGSGVVGSVLFFNSQSFIPASSMYLRNWGSLYTAVRFAPERSTWLYSNNRTIDNFIPDASTDSYVLKGYATPKTLSTVTQTITRTNTTATATTNAIDATNDTYRLFGSNTATVKLNSIFTTQAADNGTRGIMSAVQTRTAVFISNTRASAGVSVKFDPVRANYITTNNAGINIISVYIYEPVYGGLTPPISSSGQFGGVQSGVLGYQYWT
jgi:hypothetical protein